MSKHRKKDRYPAAKEVERENRLARIESMLLRGVKNQSQIAAAFQITEAMVSKDVTEIRRRWGNRDPDEKELKLQERVAQLEDILRLSLNSFDRSRKDIEEFSVSIKPCEVCGGDGKYEKDNVWHRCRPCGGKGRIAVEQTKVKESPGDPSFLKIAKECVVEVARLQGLYPDGKVGMLRRIVEEERTGGQIREKTEELYLTAPVDAVIGAMAAIDLLKNSTKKSKQKIVFEAEASNAQSYNEGEPDTPSQERTDGE